MADEKEGNGDWKPTLGDVLRPRPPNVELRRLQEVGFDPTITTRRGKTQNSGKTRDKNNDGEHHPQQLEGENLMTQHAHHNATENNEAPIRQPAASTPTNTPAMPIQLVLTDDVKRALSGNQSWSEDLIRFAPKAAIATVFAFGAAVGYHYLTRPVGFEG